MGRRPLDRRVRRTRRRLKKALLELVDEKEWSRVTVREVVDRADVARSTFYAHYGSLDDLLFAGFDEWLLSLADATGTTSQANAPSDRAFRFSLPLLEHARGRRRFFRSVFVSGRSARPRRRLVGILAEVAGSEMRGPTAPPAGAAQGRGDGWEREAAARSVAGAFLGVLEWWLEESPGTPATEVDRIFQRTVRAALPPYGASTSG